MSERIDGLKESAAEENFTPSLREFCDIIDSLKFDKIEAVADIDFNADSMWAKSSPKMQGKINGELLKKKQENMIHKHIPRADNPEDRYNPDAMAVRVIRLNNEDSLASAWLTANPAISFNKMGDESFGTSFAIRMCLPVGGSRTHCVCGAEVDKFLMHAHVCPATAVRAAIRSDAHSSAETRTRIILGMGIKGGKQTIAVGKPRVSDFLQARDGQDTGESFSDIAIHSTAPSGRGNTENTLIDVTFTSPLAKYVRDIFDAKETAYAPGDAGIVGEERKAEHYGSRFHTDQCVGGSVQLQTLSFETTGAAGPSTRKYLQQMADNIAMSGAYEEGGEEQQPGGTAPAQKLASDLSLRLIKQIYSVSLWNWQARSLRKSIKYYTLDSRPSFPYTPGSNCSLTRTDPPAFIGLPANYRRTYAVIPLPARSPPGLTARSLHRT
jgi:hypothetical protein